MDKFSPFTDSMRLFHAQSIIGFVSMTLPTDSCFDSLRQILFECSMKILDASDKLDEILEKNQKEEKR